MGGTNRTTEQLRAILEGDRAQLARAITLVESSAMGDRQAAAALLSAALPHAGRSLRVGVTGIPGVGKSTLVEALGKHAIHKGHRVAVLAVDPSSNRSGGSILGDKTRMADLARSADAFIRPTASSGHLGGVARRTKESIILCEAAGYDLILVETVGVGQSESDVEGITDLNLLLMIPGAGDELQGIKRGIMESADVLVLTKAGVDPSRAHATARQDLVNAIAYLPPRDNGRRPEVITTDALTGSGIPQLFSLLLALRDQDQDTGTFQRRRSEQDIAWMHRAIREGLMDLFIQRTATAALLSALENDVRSGKANPFEAADLLLQRLRRDAGHLP